MHGVEYSYLYKGFNECFATDNVDKACALWTEKVLNIARTHIPNKVVTVRPQDSPWYTSELRYMKRLLNRYFKKYKKTKSSEDWETYKTARNNYQHELDIAESEHRNKLTQSLATSKNTRKWWNTARWLLGRGGVTSYPNLNVNDNQVSDNREKAIEFNKYFLSHSDIDLTDASLPEVENFPENLSTVYATENEVLDLIKSIDSSKATGPDGLSPRLLHEANISIVPSLTRLLNLSLSTSKVPRQWKHANVIPLFKKGDPSDINNYRPVSLLPCVSKILERIVFKHLFNYIRDNNLISPHQSGFQPGDSTVNQLSFLYHTFCEALDNKKEVHIVFCDISKAFDRVWHEGLIFKLKKMGIHGRLLQWFMDYLSERYQCVIIRGQKSEYGLIKAAVPQGSVLGPLLFLIYINDLIALIRSNIKLFADDTSLYIEIDEPNAAVEQLNNDLITVQEWANQWLVKFSPTKTKLMTCSYKSKAHPDICFNDVVLADIDNHKHLGLTLSKDMTWSAHVTNILKSVSPMADVLKSLKYKVDRKSLETIYFSFIRPKLEYGSYIWDNCSKQDTEQLEKFQLDIARIITGARKGTSHDLIYNEISWPKLSERRSRNKVANSIKMEDNKTQDY